jgi:hypothetical protein
MSAAVNLLDASSLLSSFGLLPTRSPETFSPGVGEPCGRAPRGARPWAGQDTEPTPFGLPRPVGAS